MSPLYWHCSPHEREQRALIIWQIVCLTPRASSQWSHSVTQAQTGAKTISVMRECGVFPSYSRLSKLFVHLTASDVKSKIADSGFSSFHSTRSLTLERLDTVNLHASPPPPPSPPCTWHWHTSEVARWSWCWMLSLKHQYILLTKLTEPIHKPNHS